MLIFGLDALDTESVERFGCEDLKQSSHGSTDISSFQEPKTAILWASFLTGRNMEEEIPPDCLWTFQVPPEDSFVRHFQNPVMLDFPSFSYRLGDHQQEKDLLKKYFVDDGGPEVIEEYERVVWEIHEGTKQQLWLKVRPCPACPAPAGVREVGPSEPNLGRIFCPPAGGLREIRPFPDSGPTFRSQIGSNLIGAYFNLVDSIGHLSFGTEEKMREAYQELNQLVAEAKQLRPNDDCLIVSDHGMKAVGRYGDHTLSGFWSFSSKLDLDHPNITAFRQLIENLATTPR